MPCVKKIPASTRTSWPLHLTVCCLLLPAAYAQPSPSPELAAPGVVVQHEVPATAPSLDSVAPVVTPPAPPPPAPASIKPPQVAGPTPAPRPNVGANAQARPSWLELTPMQQLALRPLAGRWGEISEPQRRKWIALSQNFHTLPPLEQTKLHSRMTEWAALSVQQRNQARLNFAETKKLAPDDKKAQWEAYQALSPEEKQKLAEGAPKKTPGAAVAIKPVSPQKMVVVPKNTLRTDGKNGKEAGNEPPSHTLLPLSPVPPPPAERKL